MITCNICGREFKNKRAAHAHLLTVHGDEYRRAGMQQDEFVTSSGDQETKKDRPDGFRHLNPKNAAERRALEFYDYIDNEENLYTTEEAKEKRWI